MTPNLSNPDSRRRRVAVRFVGVLLVSLCALALVVGTPALAAGACPNEERRAEQSFGSGLADCRAYEMVSPLDKGDNSVNYERGRAAASGEAVSYSSVGSFTEPKAAMLLSAYLSRRGAGGWSTRNISPPFTDYVGAAVTERFPFEEQLFMSDLSRGVVQSPYTPLVSGQPIGYINLYVANTETEAYEAVTTVTPEKEYKPFTEGQYGGTPEEEGGSSDLSHVVFQQRASLCCGASPHQLHVYEWADGSLRQVDVTPQGGQFAGPANVGASAGQPSRNGNPWRAVSSDGSRVVFTGGEEQQDGEEREGEGQVYVRENPMSAVEGCAVAGDACTVEVSASQRTNGRGEPEPDPNAGKNPLQPPVAWYRDASADGSRVFFTSRVELTNDANTGPEDNAANLYEYNVESGVLTDLTVDTNPEDVDGAGVLGLVTAGEDGSHVYFVAEGKLTGEANSEGKEAVSGKPNLYLAHAGRVTFIATLSSVGDENDWAGREDDHFDYGPGTHTARVTPDGTRLAFESELRLTKYDNEAAGPGECENERCREVYLYDATTGKLVCASCGTQPDERPVGSSGLADPITDPTDDPYYRPRNLSEDGRRLFFVTTSPLVPSDSNGRLDVYEWEQVGEGSCTTVSASYAASEEGCTFPVSDVTGALESHFLDASASGNDVFIATADQLVASDTDDREDVYDVRVAGGFPVASALPVCESADSCRPPASAQPGLFGTPASQAFSGSGNPAAPATAPVVMAPKQRAKPAKCRKGLVQKRGRCVKRKRGRTTARKARQSGFDGRRR